MSAPHQPTPPEDGDTRLESWKEIAAYLHRGPRTVQRWEKVEGLPVHRHMHERQGTVYAFRSEIDAWWASRRAQLEGGEEVDQQPAPVSASTTSAVPQRAFGAWRVAGLSVAIAAALLGGAVSWRAFTVGTTSDWRIGPAMPLTSSPGNELDPVFSPDGKHVAFAWEADKELQSDIYIQTVAKGEPRRLTQNPDYDISPCWSPDGTWIAFVRYQRKTGAVSILVKPSAGGLERTIAELKGERIPMPFMTWSRDARWLVVVTSLQPGVPTSLYRLSVSSGEFERITEPCSSCGGDSSLAMSSDGRTIAFLRVQRTGMRDLYAVEVDSNYKRRGEPRRITHDNVLAGSPVWLPGDEELAYPIWVDFHWTWHRVSRHGGTPQPIEGFSALRPNLALAPDGKRLAYIHASVDLNLRRIDLKTGEESDANSSTRVDANPHLSADGQHIVFASDRRGNIDIWKAETEGSGAVQLASIAGKSSGSPRWSPDGKQIAFDVTDSNNADLYVMNSDGGQLRRLTSDPSREFLPSWSRDGTALYFGSDRSGDYQIWKMPLQGGPPVQMTKNGGYAAWESFDRKSLFVTKYAGKRPGPAGLWRIDLSTSAEELLIDEKMDWSRTAVGQDAIFHIKQVGAEGDEWLHRLDLRSRKSVAVRRLERHSGLGLTVSPDGRWAVYCTAEHRGADVMMAELRR